MKFLKTGVFLSIAYVLVTISDTFALTSTAFMYYEEDCPKELLK